MDHQNKTATLFDYGQDGRNISTSDLLDEFYLGKNNRGRAYDRIDIALRESNIDAFIDKATEHQESQDRKKRERIEKIEQEAEQARQADEYRKRGMSAKQALKQAMNRH